MSSVKVSCCYYGALYAAFSSLPCSKHCNYKFKKKKRRYRCTQEQDNHLQGLKWKANMHLDPGFRSKWK